MSYADHNYLDVLADIVKFGDEKSDRTGTGTRRLINQHLSFDLRVGFPLLTTKEVHFKSVVTELLWFLRGDTNIKFLQEHKCRIWDSWATESGEIGPMYGKQWRRWEGKNTRGEPTEIDQIKQLIDDLVRDPDSRRMVVSAWNVADLPYRGVTPVGNATHGYMALAPCHFSFQCFVTEGILSMVVTQRSADFFLGVPFNIASYALLMHILAQVTGLTVGHLHWNGGDCHVYNNHMAQSQEQIQRYLDNKAHSSPYLELNPNIMNIDDFTHDDIRVLSYHHEPAIKAPIAV